MYRALLYFTIYCIHPTAFLLLPACGSDCLECTDDTTCTLCDVGYGVDSSDACVGEIFLLNTENDTKMHYNKLNNEYINEFIFQHVTHP